MTAAAQPGAGGAEAGRRSRRPLARLVSTDHKVVAKQFLWAGLVFLAIGGALAMAMRWQWAFPGKPVPLIGRLLFPDSGGAVTPASYTSLFTNHGLIMIFFAITPILIGCFGNFCIPLMIGARDMAFPRLNAASFWTFLAAQVLVLVSLVAPGGAASSGWTMYPPLSTGVSDPGLGQTLMLVALFVAGMATLLGAINYVTTVITCRAPGMTWTRLPLTVWGLWLTAILNALFVPVLGAAAMLLFCDRVFGTQFFTAGFAGVGDPILYQHLFWIFAHPEVYILILPVFGIVCDLCSFFARKPAFWYRGSVGAMVAITAMSGLVYGHHMFQTGMGPLLGASFEALTLSISVPSVILAGNWLRTLWRGSIRLTVPMVFALGAMFVFGVGGLAALPLGAITTDIWLHDSLWVVGHFHLIMAAATFLGSFAALYFWFPKMFGRKLDPRLGMAHAILSIVLLVATFSLLLAAGYAGQPRRLFDPYLYDFVKPLRELDRAASYFAFALAASQLVFVVNFFYSLWRGPRAEDNPWRVTTLEWSIPSPAPAHNFDELPTVRRGPHELGNPRVIERLGRDFIGQHEPDLDPEPRPGPEAEK